MWVWIGIAIVVTVAFNILAFSLARIAGNADRALERFNEEEHSDA